MHKPRVIFINRVYWPSQAATAQLLTDLAEGLAARGWNVHVIAAGTEPGSRHGVEIHRTGAGEQHGGMISRLFNYWRFNRRAQQRVAQLALPGDVVVPMTDPPMLGASITATARKRGAAVVHWIQDIYPEILTAHIGRLAEVLLRPLRRRRDRAWRAAGRCVTLGTEMARQVAAQGLRADGVTLVPNWAPRELQTPPAALAVAAKRAAWDVAGRFVVAYSGNLGRVHEFRTVLAAAERLRDNPRIVFLFIGRGARFDELRTLARSRQLDNIRFLPPEPRETLAVALAAADAHLVTLLPAFERLVFPSKLAGVLAAGRPVLFVGPPAGEIARLLAAEDCGRSVEPGDGPHLAEIIRQWHADPDRCRQLGRHARAAFERSFTLDLALARWDAILRQAAAGA